MVLLVPADFRPGSGGLASHEAVGRYTLSASEANDTDLTATIARMTTRVESLTGDDFIADTGILKVSPLYQLDKLWLPKRASAITQVATRDEDGTLTVQAATVYRANLSLTSSGDALAYPRVMDNIELLGTTAGLASVPWPWVWPVGPQAVEVTGTFGWTTAPGDIQRAVALLCFHHYKPLRLDLGMTTRITAAGETMEIDTEGETGIYEVDEILQRYDRHTATVMG